MANQYTAFRFISDTHKECSLCGVIKLHSEFHKDSGSKRNRGLAYYCKVCANQKSRIWHSLNISKPETKNKKRNSWIKRAHGLSLQEYTEKLKAQGSTCAICGVELSTSGHNTHLDHCHKTGQLRAFLCTNCNRGLGHFQDSIENLQAAIKYLQTHNISVVDIEGGTSC